MTAALMSGGLDNLDFVTSFTSSSEKATYTYDPAGQLLGATYSLPAGVAGPVRPSESYSYDFNGNRTNPGYVTGAGNRLLSDGVYRYEHDSEGNRTARFIDVDQSGSLTTGDTEVTEYAWDARNRLKQVTNRATAGGPAAKVVDYLYDVENRWIGENIDADGDGQIDHETRFAYDGNQIVLQSEKDGSGDVRGQNLSHRYLWQPDAVDQVLADEEVATPQTPGSVVLPLTDNLGTVRDLAVYDAESNATTVANHRVYDSFGNLKSQSNAAVDCVFGFTGRPFDDATGLQNNLNRWYDAKTGRWMTKDPIGFGGEDGNTYRYVGNSPTNATDPTGLWTEAGVIRAFTAAYGDNEKAMKGMLLITSVYSLFQGTQLWSDDWSVDHDKRIIYIADDSSFFWTKTDANAAAQLYQVLADEFYSVTDLPESWGHFGRRMGSATGKSVFGGLSIVGGAGLALAPEPVLTKAGGIGACAFGSNMALEGITEFTSRQGGFNAFGEAFGTYGRWMAGAEGEASARYWIGWSEFLFTAAGTAGTSKLENVPLRQLPAATKEALQDAFKAMKARFAPKSVDQAVRAEAGGMPAGSASGATGALSNAVQAGRTAGSRFAGKLGDVFKDLREAVPGVRYEFKDLGSARLLGKFDEVDNIIYFQEGRSVGAVTLADEMQHALDFAQTGMTQAKIVQQIKTVHKIGDNAAYSWYHRRIFTRAIQNIAEGKAGFAHLKKYIGEVYDAYLAEGGQLTMRQILETKFEGLF